MKHGPGPPSGAQRPVHYGSATDKSCTHRDARVLLALVGGGHHGQVLDDFLGVFRFPGSGLPPERHGNSEPLERSLPSFYSSRPFAR